MHRISDPSTISSRELLTCINIVVSDLPRDKYLEVTRWLEELERHTAGYERASVETRIESIVNESIANQNKG